MANIRLSLFAAHLILFVFAVSTSAKEWRGIVPIRSSREDIVRLLNQCRDATQDCAFELGNEQVRIVFSGGHSDIECAKELPAGKVLLIEVKLKRPSRLAEYANDLKNFRAFDPSFPAGQGYKGYIDDNEGLILNTYQGKIIQIDYLASSEDRYLCPAYYENPESFIHVGLFRRCPPMSIRCPGTAHSGDKITVSSETDVDSAQFRWEATAGKIVSGQGTRSIVIDTTGLAGRVFTVTVSLGGSCQSSCSVEILPK